MIMESVHIFCFDGKRDHVKEAEKQVHMLTFSCWAFRDCMKQ